MPSWWKRSKSAFHRSPVTPFSSASTPSSPARASTSCVQPGGRAGRRDLLAPPKLTRQRKLRHVDDLYVALGDLRVDVSDRSSSSSPPQQRRLATASEAIEIPVPTLVSRSASAREGGAPPPRSASSPVLHPLPLPSPRPPDPSGAGAADGWCDRTTHAPRCGPFLPFLRKNPPFSSFAQFHLNSNGWISGCEARHDLIARRLLWGVTFTCVEEVLHLQLTLYDPVVPTIG